MIFRQITHDDLGCASYLVGDEDAGVAAVVDPKLEIDEYLHLARYLGVHIEHILETHNHADHVSGHGRLAAATGATIHVHRDASPDYDHEPFEDGWELELGSVRVRAIHTPGHRPEHTAFALIDTERGDEPWAVLTGDTLFVGDIARPDLAVDKREGAHDIFRSLHEKLLQLPDTCEVWPGHLGGSLCGGPGMDLKVSSTIGFEREHSPMLQIAEEDAFVEKAIAGLPPQPPNFENIVGAQPRPAAGRGGGRPPAHAAPGRAGAAGRRARRGRAHRAPVRRRAHPALDLHHRAAGRLRLEARVDRRPRAARRPGRPRRPRRPPRRRARRGGGHHEPRRLPRRRLHELARGAAAGRADPAADRRGAARPGATDSRCSTCASRPSGTPATSRARSTRRTTTSTAIPDGLDADQPVAVICGSGQRSAVAAGLLELHGAKQPVHVVDGGVGTWAKNGWPVEPG